MSAAYCVEAQRQSGDQWSPWSDVAGSRDYCEGFVRCLVLYAHGYEFRVVEVDPLQRLELRINVRPRAWARAAHVKGGGRAHKQNKAYQDQIRLAYMAGNGGRRKTWTTTSGPVAVEIDCYFRDRLKRGPAFMKQSDADNLAKNVLDALNGLAYDDDGRVCDLHVRKFFAEKDLVVVRLRAVPRPTIPKE